MMGMQGTALFSFRHPKIVISIWMIVLLLAGSYAIKLDSVLQDHGLDPQNGSYAKVQQRLASGFGVPDKPVMLLFEKTDEVAEARFRWFIEQALLQIDGMEGLAGVVSPLERQGMINGNKAYALLSFHYPPYRIAAALEQLHRQLPSYTGISIQLTGKTVVQADVNEASHKDLAKAELIGLPVAFLLLWLAFRRFTVAFLPLIIGVMGVTISMGIMYGLGTKLTLSNFVLNVIPMVGLALSIDFALMLVSRFREELKGKTTPIKALAITINTAGKAVFVSSVCVFLGLLSMLWIPLVMFSSIAIGAMTVVAVSFVLSFTLLPALLAVCLPLLYKKGSGTRASKATMWEKIARFVMRRPAVMGILGGGFLLICLIPLGNMKVAVPDASSLPDSYHSRQASDAYAASFEQSNTSAVWVMIEGNTGFQRLSDWTEAYAIVERLERDPAVIRVESAYSALQMTPDELHALLKKPLQKKKYESELRSLMKDNDLLLQVTIAGEAASGEAREWLRAWEKRAEASPLVFTLGGEAKYQQEVFDQVFGNLGYVLLSLIATNFIVLLIAFRSAVIALKTILLNLLTISAAFGIVSWIFVEGRFGMEPGSVAIMIPVFIFGLVFGISMDYGVFLLSRIYEEYRRTGKNVQSVIKGLAVASRVITSAAAIMIAVTAPFAFGEVAGVKQLGVGIAAAIFIDATIVRIVLVPSLMSYFGKWNWWAPRWLK